jgi:hypothetical protein
MNILISTFLAIIVVGLISGPITLIYLAGKSIEDNRPAPSKQWEREWEAIEENLHK